jgi:hypothetical protein
MRAQERSISKTFLGKSKLIIFKPYTTSPIDFFSSKNIRTPQMSHVSLAAAHLGGAAFTSFFRGSQAKTGARRTPRLTHATIPAVHVHDPTVSATSDP